MGRSPCCDKSKVKRGTWSPEEDATLKNYIHKHGTGGNWISLPHKAGLQRCGKSCRLRWLNYLRPDIKHGGFTQDEESIIHSLYNKIGSRWSVIASHLPGRTDNDVKNYWNTKLKKKLMSPHCSPPPKSNMETAAAMASNTAASTGSATTSGKTNNFQAQTDLLNLQDYCFPVPFLSEPMSSNLPGFILEGSSDCSSVDNINSPFYPSRQDSSHFSPFYLGEDVKNGVKMDEYSCEVVSGIWSQEEDAIRVDDNADLFSIFHVDSKARGVSQSH